MPRKKPHIRPRSSLLIALQEVLTRERDWRMPCGMAASTAWTSRGPLRRGHRPCLPTTRNSRQDKRRLRRQGPNANHFQREKSSTDTGQPGSLRETGLWLEGKDEGKGCRNARPRLFLAPCDAGDRVQRHSVRELLRLGPDPGPRRPRAEIPATYTPAPAQVWSATHRLPGK